MKHEVLQVTIGRAHGTAKPRRNKDANRSQPFGMNVEKPENFRLRKPDGMQDSPGLRSTICAEFDHHLHAERPLAGLVAWRHSDMRANNTSPARLVPARRN